uniref:ABC transporter ATP-binding protein n=1 Tax=Ndongobacter massiliensis TaxID=1871025 RepID=UPI0009302422|nr:ABC transporter ATP-binding protein [Ndongobacter massiliensis]
MGQDPKAFIHVRNLYKVYRMGSEKIRALNGINLDIARGEFICLLGPSGSGKSTLLNALAGLEKPERGEIVINGIHLEQLNESQVTLFRSQNVGFVFQSYNLIPTLTALENVSLGLSLKGVAKKKRVEMAREMLEKVGLKDRMRHHPKELSGGQQQRVSIARAFVGRPHIVFADEPTGNLDTKTSFEVMDLISEMARENQQTLVMVTHDEEMTIYADKRFHMRDGVIEKVHHRMRPEEVEEIKERYHEAIKK